MSNVCRNCRDINSKLISLKNKTLIKFYEAKCNTKLYNKDGSPKGFCNSCYQNLLRLYELGQMSEKVLCMLAELSLEESAENITRCEVELGLIPQDHVLNRERA